MHVNNKKIENILLNVILFTLTETLAPKFAVNTLVDDTNKTIAKFRYPKEKGGKETILGPENIKIIAPGKAIKKPSVADVPTASCIFLENIVSVGTLKLPPPIPIKTDINPIKKLIIKFINLDFGRSFDIIIGSFWKAIFNAIRKAKKIKTFTKTWPEIRLAL